MCAGGVPGNAGKAAQHGGTALGSWLLEQAALSSIQVGTQSVSQQTKDRA
jgi:hypothetical protein